jgi:putative iron-regulated protein
MGSLAYGELAGERMKLGLLLHDPEEEQDCFSDNTHWAHFYNLKGIENIFYGRYTRVDGSQLNGYGLVELLAKDKPLRQKIESRFQIAFDAMQQIVDSAEKKGIAYDQLLAKENAEGHQLIDNSITSLLELSNTFFEFARSLGFENIVFEGSASLDQEEEFF